MVSLFVSYLALLMLASPALFRKQARGWVIVLMIMLLGDVIALFVGDISQQVVFPGHALRYNWGYKVLSLAFNLLFAAILIDSSKFRSRELGLSFLQAPGTSRVFLTVVLPCIVLIVVQAAMRSGPRDHSLETLLFQATMPGLTEELTFRGLYLALFDRMFAARFRVFGAEMSYGAIATSLVFTLGHVRFDAHFIPQVAIVPFILATAIAFFWVWLRCRSRSLVLPVVVHNLYNTIHVIVPKLI